MDETPIWFEMVSLTTITKIGEKCIKKGGKKEIDIEKNIHVQKRKIYILCQENSWVDSEISHYWLDKIFFNNIHINNNLKKILILDLATSH